MKNSRLILPIVFFASTFLTEMGIGRSSKTLYPCSTVPFAPANTFYSDFDCGVGSVICCYLPNSASIVARIFT